MALYGDLLPYSLTAMRAVANVVYDQPERYEKLMLQAAALEPSCYYTLGDYELGRHEDDKGAQYIEQACDADPDAVRVANHAVWRVRYYLKKGQTDKARQIARDGAEVYSFVGLEAEAIFQEAMTNYDDAFDWYQKIEERYKDSAPLLAFCQRYKQQTGDNRFDAEVQKRAKNLFPKGLEKVSLTDFKAPPTDGVLVRQENDMLRSSSLRAGDVIVALGGTRTHNFKQYSYLRDQLTDPWLDLIVWQGSAYHQLKASPPNHRFGVDFGDYQPQ